MPAADKKYPVNKTEKINFEKVKMRNFTLSRYLKILGNYIGTLN